MTARRLPRAWSTILGQPWRRETRPMKDVGIQQGMWRWKIAQKMTKADRESMALLYRSGVRLGVLDGLTSAHCQ